MISYIYVYASLARVAFGKDEMTLGRKLRIRFAAISGLCTTVLGLVVAFIPSHQVDSVWRFEIKMILSCTAFLGLAAALFIYYSRRRTRCEVLPVEV